MRTCPVQVKDIMVEQILSHGERVALLINRTDHLFDRAHAFCRRARRVRRKLQALFAGYFFTVLGAVSPPLFFLPYSPSSALYTSSMPPRVQTHCAGGPVPICIPILAACVPAYPFPMTCSGNVLRTVLFRNVRLAAATSKSSCNVPFCPPSPSYAS